MASFYKIAAIFANIQAGIAANLQPQFPKRSSYFYTGYVLSGQGNIGEREPNLVKPPSESNPLHN